MDYGAPILALTRRLTGRLGRPHEKGELDVDVPTESLFGWSNMFVAPEEGSRREVRSCGERAIVNDLLTACR
jgi:hypothetical protein